MIPNSVCCLLILLLIPTLASAKDNSNAPASNSIHFIALPYLNSFHYNHNNQPNIASHLPPKHDLSEHHWGISTTSIPDLVSSHGTIQTLDTDQTTAYRLTGDLSNIITPIPETVSLLPPMHALSSATAPLWLQYRALDKTTWHCPNLTPKAAAQMIAAKKEAQRLSKHMADRAFYFGYDTNEDALE